MKIISKYTLPGYVDYILRYVYIFYSAAILLSSAVFVFSAVNAAMTGDIISQLAALAISFFVAFVLALILRSIIKTRKTHYLNHINSTYRYEETEFGDEGITCADFSHFYFSRHFIKYRDIRKAVFTKDAVYIRFMNVYNAFSRAALDADSEARLIALLSQKLNKKQFNPGRIPKKNVAGVKEITLVPERETADVFPPTHTAFTLSAADLDFIVKYNHLTGKRNRQVLFFCSFFFFAALFLVIGLTAGEYLEDFTSFVLTLSYVLLGTSALFLFIFLLNRGVNRKSAKTFGSAEITVTDFFVTFKISYICGTVMQTSYNFAAITSAAEFKDYIVCSTVAGFIIIPKAGILNSMEMLRQIFHKELGPKFRCFPDKG